MLTFYNSSQITKSCVSGTIVNVVIYSGTLTLVALFVSKSYTFIDLFLPTLTTRLTSEVSLI